MVFYPGWRAEEGEVELAGKSFELSRVITQKRPFIEINAKMVEVEFWEVMDNKGEGNLGFVHMGNDWIQGHTKMRRWKGQGGRAERQNVFTSEDNKISFVVTSEPITV